MWGAASESWVKADWRKTMLCFVCLSKSCSWWMVSRIGTILVQWQQCAGGRALTSSCVAPGVREQSVGRAAPVPYQVLPLSCLGHRHWNVCFLQPSQGWPPPLGAENKRKRGEECCGHKRNNISGLSWDFLMPPVLVVRLSRMLFNQTFSVVCEDFLTLPLSHFWHVTAGLGMLYRLRAVVCGKLCSWVTSRVELADRSTAGGTLLL